MATVFALGIDVSSYQSVDDWTAVKNFGTAKAYCKATEGATWVDPTYFSHMNGARNVGIQPGPYHFWRPNDRPDVQAHSFCQHAGWNPDWMPPVLDLEVVAPGQSASDAAAAVRVWLEIVGNFTGTPCRIYTNISTWQALGNPADFTQHQLWIAFPTNPGSTAAPPGIGGWGPGGWTGWQYSFDGQVAGIAGAVDLTHWRP